MRYEYLFLILTKTYIPQSYKYTPRYLFIDSKKTCVQSLLGSLDRVAGLLVTFKIIID